MLCKLKTGFSFLLLLTLSACVSPRYQTAYRYDPPSDAAGRACLAQCEPKLANCQIQCADKHQACVKNLEPQIEAHFEQSMQQYQRDLQHYQYAYDQYQRRFAWGYHGYRGYHPRFGAWPYYSGFESSFPPTPPFKPSRERIAAKLTQQQCGRDCGCQPIYDACFLGCGGTKTPEVKCVANCAREK